jgi:hypothetical protein
MLDGTPKPVRPPHVIELGLLKVKNKTYNTRDSPVVTQPSTNLAITGLSMGERTGSRVFLCLWSYVEALPSAEDMKLPHYEGE